MVRLLLTLVLFLAWAPGLVWPQNAWAQNAWVQVEAHPTLVQAQDRARAYARALPDVNGFRIGSGWYALTIGPYSAEEARRRLLEWRRAGIVPRDSYVSDGREYRQRFWPAGGGTAATTPRADQDTSAAQIAPTPPAPVDETPREARQSEARLNRDERVELQRLLQWFGFYTAALDGAFGRGTRAAMAEWQRSNGFEATGILTTAQRARLAEEYDAALAELGLENVVDREAGIAITMPAALVEFDRYDPPFVHYTPRDDNGIRLVLISQYGDRDTLGGLYEIMQTLEIVPPEGERSRRPDSFVLTGQSETLHSYTMARLETGQIKGFTLAYPPERASDMQRVVAIMEDSLESLGVALDPALGAANEQAVDLVSGLELRQPKRAASGFFVDASGRAVTFAETVANCDRITLDKDFDAEIVAQDAVMALLAPVEALVPIGYGRLANIAPRLRSEIAVGGYSYGGALSGPTVTYGALEDVRGLDGSDDVLRLRISTLDGDVGGPVLSSDGAVTGMLLPQATTDRDLPAEAGFAVPFERIAAFLQEAGVTPARREATPPMAAEDLTTQASDMTVLVSCW